MKETLFVLVLTAIVFVALVFLRQRESRYLKKRTRDALAPRLKEEFEKEREETLERQKKFNEAMKKAGM
ncbi:MAG: hypothetical protein Q7S98_05130 [Deltaproteobacteria bacterium]|nr:hypothetical protein [Deltaproteobacteria bacterium]